LSAESSAMVPRLRSLRADLHIHTALSPCASEEMTPPAIVETALAAGLDVIAVSDHNTAGNVEAVQRAAEAAGGGLSVFPGMEITSVEEVHVLGLFPDLKAAETVAARVRTLLPTADADYYAFFGEQPLAAADGRTVGTETTALAAATTLDLSETVQLIHSVGGLAVAAHIDRRAFGVLSQLGCFTEDAGFDAVEVSRHMEADSPRMDEFRGFGLPIIGSSDGHYLNEIGMRRTLLTVAEPTFDEVLLAFAGAEGRGVDRA
jgi:predicted metal-dependent phosphoesterase TrpH